MGQIFLSFYHKSRKLDSLEQFPIPPVQEDRLRVYDPWNLAVGKTLVIIDAVGHESSYSQLLSCLELPLL